MSEFRSAQVFLAQSLWWLQLEFPFRAFDILLMGDAFFGPFEGAFMVTSKIENRHSPSVDLWFASQHSNNVTRTTASWF